MVKLTAELIYDSRQYINAVKDRELCLRGWKIPAIENLGVTNNQFDTIDFTDNALKRLENFPLLPRLRCLLLSNNSIVNIQTDIGKYLPNVRDIVLINNNMQELGDLHPLASFPRLEYVSLLGNPVAKNKVYRLYMIFKFPKVRVIDFRRVRDKERQAAKDMFKGARGKALRHDVVKFSGKTSTAAAAVVAQVANGEPSTVAMETSGGEQHNGEAAAAGDTSTAAADLHNIREAIAAASSLQEIDRLGDMLSQGHVPPTHKQHDAQAAEQSSHAEPEIVEEVEME